MEIYSIFISTLQTTSQFGAIFVEMYRFKFWRLSSLKSINMANLAPFPTSVDLFRRTFTFFQICEKKLHLFPAIIVAEFYKRSLL